MKTTLTFLTILLCLNIYSQEEIPQKKMFLRVYNQDGKKIHKGKIISISDSILMLKRGSKLVEIPFNEIGFIKTRHSFGHNVLVGSAIGAGTALVIIEIDHQGVSGNDIDSWNAIGMGLFTSVGAVVGVVTNIGKNGRVNVDIFEINGKSENFKVFKNVITDNK